MIRRIRDTDNETLAKIIRKSLEDHGLALPGTVYTDESTDHLCDLFQTTPGSVYFVLEEGGEILGGCGVFPTKGLPQRYAELVKLYLRDGARGRGWGRTLIETSIEWARKNGYTHLYLETMTPLASAVKLYEKLGFVALPKPPIDSDHFTCDIWMMKEL
jgi:putative acetyltransferase